MTASTQNTRRYLLSGALVVAIAAGAYGIGRVYPPLGPSAGTIAPADRYVKAQVGAKDVTLGDTSVAQLMQTDAFELISKDANFRALAADPGFASIAGNAQLMQAVANDPKAFADFARNPKMAQSAMKVAEMMAADMRAKGPQAQIDTVMAANPGAFKRFAQDPASFAVLASYPGFFSQLAARPQLFQAAMANPGFFAKLAADGPAAMKSAFSNPANFAVLAQNAGMYMRLAQDRGLMNAMAKDSAAFQKVAMAPIAFQKIAGDAAFRPNMIASMRAMAANADMFRASAQNAKMLAASAQAAEMTSRKMMDASMAARAVNPALAQMAEMYPRMMASMAANPVAFAQLLNNGAAMRALAQNADAISMVAKSPNFAALAAYPGFQAAMQSGDLSRAMNTGMAAR